MVINKTYNEVLAIDIDSTSLESLIIYDQYLSNFISSEARNLRARIHHELNTKMCLTPRTVVINCSIFMIHSKIRINGEFKRSYSSCADIACKIATRISNTVLLVCGDYCVKISRGSNSTEDFYTIIRRAFYRGQRGVLTGIKDLKDSESILLLTDTYGTREHQQMQTYDADVEVLALYYNKFFNTKIN